MQNESVENGGCSGDVLLASRMLEGLVSFSSPTIVIPGRPKGEPGIHRAAMFVDEWIPGSRLRRAPE